MDNPNTRPLIRFKGLIKRFGLLTAIKGPDLAIYPCELFALLGPSGRTKTAMMWMLARFDTSTEGKIHLDGRDIVSGLPHWRPVNMIFISCAVPASECLGHLPCGLCRSGPPQARPDFRRPAPAHGLGARLKLLLLDEPLAALHKKLHQDAQCELMDIQERIGTTFVIMTHD
ncbi:hypothetical protein ACEUZ9_005427 [Paracoccus litorisediminis]|jgi:putrescine transport system ATP-binding protein|uniref:ATP-binding cassette domain-containing protein n=1 Tax=Paracoccus litorisediminis TaxID=2006130 RepID=UPI00372D91A2